MKIALFHSPHYSVRPAPWSAKGAYEVLEGDVVLAVCPNAIFAQAIKTALAKQMLLAVFYRAHQPAQPINQN